jgi:hypothetical protein
MLWQLYLRKGTAYVPTVAQTEAGFYTDIEPVAVIPVTDSRALEIAIKVVMNKGNPIVPTPTRAAFPKPIVLEYAKVKSWSAFEKDALNWTIVEEAGNYKIKPARKRADGIGWEADPDRVEALPPGTTHDDIARRIASLLAQAAVGLAIFPGAGDAARSKRCDNLK